jgi:DNA-binding CsgD family transcriptional regulator
MALEVRLFAVTMSSGICRCGAAAIESSLSKEILEMSHLKLIHLDSTRSYSGGRPAVTYRPYITSGEPTPRELEVESLLCRGYSQENIAAILGRSVNTISAHALRLYRKRGVHTQTGLLLAYLERKGIFVFTDELPQREAAR